MDEKRFTSDHYGEPQSVSRELDNYPNQPSHYTIKRPRKMNQYDPWADWFNAGIDPQPFINDFSGMPDPGNTPVFSGEDQSGVNPFWMTDQAQLVQTGQDGEQAQLDEFRQLEQLGNNSYYYDPMVYPTAEYQPAVEYQPTYEYQTMPEYPTSMEEMPVVRAEETPVETWKETLAEQATPFVNEVTEQKMNDTENEIINEGIEQATNERINQITNEALEQTTNEASVEMTNITREESSSETDQQHDSVESIEQQVVAETQRQAVRRETQSDEKVMVERITDRNVIIWKDFPEKSC